MTSLEAPVETYRGSVAAWECDIFGHLNIAFYGERFADAAQDLLERAAPGWRWRTVALDTSYEREFRAGDGIVIKSRVLAADAAGVQIGHEAFTSATGIRTTRAEHRLVPIAASPMPALAAAAAGWTSLRDFAWPRGAGRIAAGRDRIKPSEMAESTLSILGYVNRFSNACLHVIEAIGMDPDYRSAAHRGFSTFETRLEVEDPGTSAGEGLVTTSGIVAVGRSSLGMLHRLASTHDGRSIARFYQAGVHFDLAARRASPWPEAMRAKAAALALADA